MAEHKTLMGISVEDQGGESTVTNFNQMKSAGQEVQKPGADGDSKGEVQKLRDEFGFFSVPSQVHQLFPSTIVQLVITREQSPAVIHAE